MTGPSESYQPLPEGQSDLPQSMHCQPAFPEDEEPQPEPPVHLARAKLGSDNKIKVAEPNSYDGSPRTFRDWFRQVSIYLRAKKIEEDEARILVALSYMKEGMAANWANHFYDKCEEGEYFGTWSNFRDLLRTTFQDKTHGQRAREKLETFKQGTHRVDDFIAKFDMMAIDANVTANESEMIRLLERST